MSRKQEIIKKALSKYPEGTNRYLMFIEGAKWADKNPKEGTINVGKACSVFAEMLIELCPELIGYGAMAKQWEDEFRKKLTE